MTDTAEGKTPSSSDRYRLYIDESGDHIYHHLYDIPNRYLGLLGVWFERDTAYADFADELEKFKCDIFGFHHDKPVILHRKDIINYYGVFEKLKDENTRSRFYEGLQALIERAQFNMMCVVLNKQKHEERFPTPLHPYHYAFGGMLDRYTDWLYFKNAVGDVVVESRERKEDRRLNEKKYWSIYEDGTTMYHQRSLTSKNITFEDKDSHVAGLQLADILAYPVKHALLAEKCHQVPKLKEKLDSKLIEIIDTKFNNYQYHPFLTAYGKSWE